MFDVAGVERAVGVLALGHIDLIAVDEPVGYARVIHGEGHRAAAGTLTVRPDEDTAVIAPITS